MLKAKGWLLCAMLSMAVALPAYAANDAAAQLANSVPGVETTADGVTLPLYPNHEVVIHYTDASPVASMNGEQPEEDALPTLMLTSPDSVQDVVSFYEDELSGFTRLDVSSENVTFGKDFPADLEITDMERWMSIIPYYEHVSIYSLAGDTTIEIAYQPD